MWNREQGTTVSGSMSAPLLEVRKVRLALLCGVALLAMLLIAVAIWRWRGSLGRETSFPYIAFGVHLLLTWWVFWGRVSGRRSRAKTDSMVLIMRS